MGFNRNEPRGEGEGAVEDLHQDGDDGETGLFGAGRVSKITPVDAYGQVDELNAAIGLAMALDPDFCRELLETVARPVHD